MPKQKTKQAVSKRVRVTKSGKIKAKHANRRHILTAKGTKSKRLSRGTMYISKADQQRIKDCLPYGQA